MTMKLHHPLSTTPQQAATQASSASLSCFAWLTSYQQALNCAKQLNRIVLLDFNGVPWCSPCNLQESEVFEAQTFKVWAHATVVLLKVNLGVGNQAFVATDPNQEPLIAKYKMNAPGSGVPTVVAINADGTERRRCVGYSGEGPTEWITCFVSEAKL
jgi:thiol:disulfide interchange protein